jgi:hypothetical protein
MIKKVGVVVVNKSLELADSSICHELSEDVLKDYDFIFPEDAPHQIATVLIEVEYSNEPEANHHS